MNETSKIVSDILADNYRSSIFIGGKPYVVLPPTIRVLSRATPYFCKIDISEGMSNSALMRVIAEQRENIIKGLSYLVVGDVEKYEAESVKMAKSMRCATNEELSVAVAFAINKLISRDFLALASTVKDLLYMVANPKL